MKLTKRNQRTAKKLVRPLILPLIAVAMMATMMFMESASRRSHLPSTSLSSLQQHDLRSR